MARSKHSRRRVSEDPYARHKSELDLTHGMHAEPVHAVAVVLVVGVIAEALFNAQGLAKWAQTLPQNQLADWVVIASFEWHAWMKALGTAEIFDAVRQAFYALRAMPPI
jgi:hypothetical protein